MCCSVIKPIVKNKSPSDIDDEPHNVSKEKLPTERPKSSVTKSKTHFKDKAPIVTEPPLLMPLAASSREDEIVIVPEHKPTKSKKLTVISSSTVVNIDIPSTASSSPSISSSGINSITPSIKQKTNSIKKPKKVTQQHPAFYFVSMFCEIK